MRDLIEQETRTAYNQIKKERYQWGNKSGKYLARLLKKEKTANYIEKIQTSFGELVYKTVERPFKTTTGDSTQLIRTTQQKR